MHKLLSFTFKNLHFFMKQSDLVHNHNNLTQSYSYKNVNQN